MPLQYVVTLQWRLIVILSLSLLMLCTNTSKAYSQKQPSSAKKLKVSFVNYQSKEVIANVELSIITRENFRQSKVLTKATSTEKGEIHLSERVCARKDIVLEARHPDFLPMWVYPRDFETGKDLKVELHPSRRVDGLLMSERGDPLQGAVYVQVFSPPLIQKAALLANPIRYESDETGRFQFHLPVQKRPSTDGISDSEELKIVSGSYLYVSAVVEGYMDQPRRFEVTPDSALIVPLKLDPRNSGIFLKVVDRHGEPLDGATVATSDGFSYIGQTDEMGQIEIPRHSEALLIQHSICCDLTLEQPPTDVGMHQICMRSARQIQFFALDDGHPQLRISKAGGEIKVEGGPWQKLKINDSDQYEVAIEPEGRKLSIRLRGYETLELQAPIGEGWRDLGTLEFALGTGIDVCVRDLLGRRIEEAQVGLRILSDDGSKTKDYIQLLESSHGFFRFGNMQACTAVMKVWAPGYVVVEKVVKLKKGQLQQFDISLEQGVQISGVIVDANGEPLAHALIASGSSKRGHFNCPQQQSYSTEDGSFNLSGIIPKQAFTLEIKSHEWLQSYSIEFLSQGDKEQAQSLKGSLASQTTVLKAGSKLQMEALKKGLYQIRIQAKK